MKNMLSRRGLFVGVLLVAAAVAPLAAAHVRADRPPTSRGEDHSRCQALRLAVALAPGAPADQTISATLCIPGQSGDTLQILIHGFTYSHLYWDFPYRPGRYSFVRAMSRAGYATLNLDRLGIGASSHPSADALTGASEAYVTHQLVQLARRGALGGESFDHVVLVSHSLGNAFALIEAATYRDVDGLALTGFDHADGDAATWDYLLSNLVPAQIEPRLANLPPGYITTARGIRGVFYHLPDVEPAVIALDEATKETGSYSEFDAFDTAFSPATDTSIRIPMFDTIAEFDGLFGCVISCGQPGSPPPPAVGLAAEHTYFPNAPFETYVQPRSGHDQNLHVTAPAFYAALQSWFARHGFGPTGGGQDGNNG
jgi:hypothetical protein